MTFAVEGVIGVWGSTLLATAFLFFFVSRAVPAMASSSIEISGKPDSMPHRVRKSSSRSFLKRRSFSFSFSSSKYRASSSAICSGVRFSKLATYCLRRISLSVGTGDVNTDGRI